MHRVALSSSLLLLLPLFWGSVCQHAARSGLNVTEQNQNWPSLKTPDTPGTDVSSSGVDYEETEEDMKELMIPQFLMGDSVRAESQVKKPAKSETGKKKSDKSKRKGNKGKKNKKKTRTPCEGEFKNFCIHGECKFIEHLERVTCKCRPEYFGERCVEQFLKTHRSNDAASHSTTVLVVVAVALSVLSLAVIVIIVVVQVRKKCPIFDEKEERKKLRQENGSSNNDV